MTFPYLPNFRAVGVEENKKKMIIIILNRAYGITLPYAEEMEVETKRDKKLYYT